MVKAMNRVVTQLCWDNLPASLLEMKKLKGEASGILKAFTTALLTSNETDCWIIDSGATDHMTNKVINLHHLKKKFKSLTCDYCKWKKCLSFGEMRNKFTLSKNTFHDPLCTNLSFPTFVNWKDHQHPKLPCYFLTK